MKKTEFSELATAADSESPGARGDYELSMVILDGTTIAVQGANVVRLVVLTVPLLMLEAEF